MNIELKNYKTIDVKMTARVATPLEQYKAKKLEAFRKLRERSPFIDYCDLDAFLSQTIDELWALPARREITEEDRDDDYALELNICQNKDTWNACIAEAERMRFNKIK